jgi:hypothetical protein
VTAPARVRADIEQYVTLKVPNFGRQAVSRFRVLVWRRHPLTAGKAGAVAPPLVVMSDAPSTRGPSITNATEEAWEWAQKHWPGCMMVEHYPAEGSLPDRLALVDMIDGVATWAPVGHRLTELITAASQ